MPIIEAADATVLVDRDTGNIQSYDITGSVSPAESAWSDVFIRHSLSNGNSTQHYNETYDGPLNITTSYGVMFMDFMFKAADPRAEDLGVFATCWEAINDNAFVMRDQEYGMNVDLMTYSMFSLANKDPQALLDYTTLVAHADRTFQIFFQHFVSNGLSLEEGDLVYQRIGEDSTDALGAPMAWNGSALPSHPYASLNTNRTVEAWVPNRIQVLHMNPIATYISVVIIIWLIGTTAVVTCLQ
jgi:hypothetical protein